MLGPLFQGQIEIPSGTDQDGPCADGEKKAKGYHDYVIKDGKLVGDWENLYRECGDPWGQSDPKFIGSTARTMAVNWVRRINQISGYSVSACEVGCGFGHLTNILCQSGITCRGIDISATAIEKAGSLYPECEFAVA